LMNDAQLIKAIEIIEEELGVINWGFTLGLWSFLLFSWQ
jgi:hypothetical protein